ncbi:MAG: type II toxin-antitoxin system VapC family toxin [Verrucomicrobia bacterium]|nr:type II toxin-antitoxin system VapC family toxin [Verrucomicrobiota bacterium]MCH8512045.1 type II toxin-antitoxin system VapC family toxin [Kiritimatiellia bacterium]
MSVYWDTSCLLKLYCREPDSDRYLHQIGKSAEPLITSSLTQSEIYFALLQKQTRSETGQKSAQEIFSEYMDDLNRGLIFQVPIGMALLQKTREVADRCFGVEPPVFLRTLDGIHLATAMEAGCTRLVTTDQRMKSAACVLGISLLAP